MVNKAMERKLAALECLDVNVEGELVVPGVWRLQRFTDAADYCDAEGERWIWSIGKRLSGPKAGEILASTGTEFYENPDFECLFLR